MVYNNDDKNKIVIAKNPQKMTWPQMTTIKFGSEKQNSEVKLPRKLMVQLPCNKLPCKDMVK